MKNILIFVIVATTTLFACSGNMEEKANTPFEMYPPSSYYFDNLTCVDSLINEFGNPVFIYEDSDHVRTFIELMDTSLLINGYLAPEWRWSAEDRYTIINKLKFVKK